MKIKITGTYTVPIIVQQTVKPYKCSVDLTAEIEEKDLKSLLSNQKSLFENIFGKNS